jgi:hypothetical protein
MSDLYIAFNVTIVDLFTALHTSFPDNADIEKMFIHTSARQASFKKTKEIFEEFTSSFSKEILSAINQRNVKLLYEDAENTFIKSIGGKAVYDDLKANNEHEFLWTSLQVISKHVAIISATGSSLSVFENIAKTFVANNKDLEPGQYQAALFQQLFTDKTLSSQLLSAFESPDAISKILQNVGPILSSLAPASKEYEEDDVDEEETEKDDEENKDEENKDEDESIDRRPSRIFSKANKARKKKKTKRKKKNAFGDLADLVASVDLKDDDLKELHEGVRNTLSGKKSEDGSTGLDLGEMMKQLSSGNSDGLQEMLNKGVEEQEQDPNEAADILKQLTPMISSMSSLMGKKDPDSLDSATSSNKNPMDMITNMMNSMGGGDINSMFSNAMKGTASNDFPQKVESIDENGIDEQEEVKIGNNLSSSKCVDKVSDSQIQNTDSDDAIPDDLPDLVVFEKTELKRTSSMSCEPEDLPPLPADEFDKSVTGNTD